MKTTRIAPALLAIALLLPAGCASGPPGTTIFDAGDDWDPGGTTDHPALRDGAAITWWTRGAGPRREKVGVLQAEGEELLPGDLQELARFCVPIDSPRAARAFSHLAQLLDVPGLPLAGAPVDPDPGLRGPGSGGRYSRDDAAAWDIDFDPLPRPGGGGYEVERVLLVRPWTHPDLRYTSPWRLVWTRSIVYPDGAVSLQEQRTLTNGDDAQRFVRF